MNCLFILFYFLLEVSKIAQSDFRVDYFSLGHSHFNTTTNEFFLILHKTY